MGHQNRRHASPDPACSPYLGLLRQAPARPSGPIRPAPARPSGPIRPARSLHTRPAFPDPLARPTQIGRAKADFLARNAHFWSVDVN
jgi:hypothetical protein